MAVNEVQLLAPIRKEMPTRPANVSSSGGSLGKAVITRCLSKMEHIYWTTIGDEQIPRVSEKWREPPKTTIRLLEKLGAGGFGYVWVRRRTPRVILLHMCRIWN